MSKKTPKKTPKKTAQYGQPKTADKVFSKAKPIPGMDKKIYRQDPYGNTLFKGSYGKPTPMGWEVDHIIPKSKDGSDYISNLPLQTKINREKGNSLKKKSRHNN